MLGINSGGIASHLERVSISLLNLIQSFCSHVSPSFVYNFTCLTFIPAGSLTISLNWPWPFCFVLFCFLFCGVIRKSFLIIWRRPWIVPNTWQKVQQWCAWNFARLQRTWSLKITLSCAFLLCPCSMSWRYSMNCFLAGMVVWLMVVY